MLERTRKRPTDVVALTFTGPAVKKAEALKTMLALGFQAEERGVPWREALPYTDEQLPGVFLSGARYREDLTQAQLSERTGIPRRHISEMENNKRPIGKHNARKLAEALHVDPRRFLAV